MFSLCFDLRSTLHMKQTTLALTSNANVEELNGSFRVSGILSFGEVINFDRYFRIIKAGNFKEREGWITP